MSKPITNLPLFPLQVFILPGEELQLTIFEPRYKQLINDCLENNLSFGIPYFKDDVIGPFGSEVQIIKTLHTYPNGEMDILVKCIRIFKLTSFNSTIKDKLYAGGSCEFVADASSATVVDSTYDLYRKWLSYQEDPTDEMRNARNWMEIAIEIELDASEKLHLFTLSDEKRTRYQEGLMQVLVSLLSQEKELGDRVLLN